MISAILAILETPGRLQTVIELVLQIHSRALLIKVRRLIDHHAAHSVSVDALVEAQRAQCGKQEKAQSVEHFLKVELPRQFHLEPIHHFSLLVASTAIKLMLNEAGRGDSLSLLELLGQLIYEVLLWLSSCDAFPLLRKSLQEFCFVRRPKEGDHGDQLLV